MSTAKDRTAIAWLITCSALLGAAVYFASPARAEDGVLDPDEARYALRYGEVICDVMAEHASIPGVVGITEAVAEDGFTLGAAVDIVNESVADYCPRYWPLLQAVGRAARAGTLT